MYWNGSSWGYAPQIAAPQPDPDLSVSGGDPGGGGSGTTTPTSPTTSTSSPTSSTASTLSGGGSAGPGAATSFTDASPNNNMTGSGTYSSMGLSPFTSTGAPTIGMTDFSSLSGTGTTNPTNQFNLNTYNANQTPATPIATPQTSPSGTAGTSPATWSSMGLNSPFATPQTAPTSLPGQYFNPATSVNGAPPVTSTPAITGVGTNGGGPGAVTSPYGPNPYIPNPTGNNALSGGTIAYNPSYYPTIDTANAFAKQVGGTVVNVTGLAGSVSNNQPQYMVRLANGQMVNPGTAAALYTNPNYNGHQGQIDQQLSMLLNNNAPGSLNPGQGLYTVKNGVVTYDPNGSNQIQESTPISQHQYDQWVGANAGNGTPVNGLPGNQQGGLTAPQSQIAQAYQQAFGGQQYAFGSNPNSPGYNPNYNYGPTSGTGGATSSPFGLQPGQFAALLQQLGPTAFLNLLASLSGNGGATAGPTQGATGGATGGLDMNTLLQLIMLMGNGGGSGPGGLYTRAQYPMFP